MASRWSRAGCAGAALVVLTGCVSFEKETPRAEEDPPDHVTLGQLADGPSVRIAQPDFEVPGGVTPEQVDWMVGQLLPAARRSLEVGQVSRRSEAEAVAWVLAPFKGAGTIDRAARIAEEYGTGHSFLVGNRFALDAQPVGPVHVLGREWRASVGDDRVRVELLLEMAIPFDDGVAVVKREIAQTMPVTETPGRFYPGYRVRARTLGLDDCATITEGAARPGGLGEVAEHLDDLTVRREEGGLSRWAAGVTSISNPTTEDRARCADEGWDDR